ncbi:MAG: ABC transporter permease [Spirochaetales bacterium]|nr:ABC transporter permease [Spirochaetales bacterium]
MFFENIKLSFKDFAGNKLRTFLSVLGIVIGVASIITITTLGQSASVSIKNQVATMGLETINIFTRGNDSESRRIFTPELADKIKENVEGVKDAIPVNRSSMRLQRGRDTYQANVTAVSASFTNVFDYETENGKFINDEDNLRRKSVVVLGAEAAIKLFPDGDAVGKYIRIYRKQAKSFRVIGVMKTKTAVMGMDFDTSVYVPRRTYDQRLQHITRVRNYVIGTKKGGDVLSISKKIEDYLLKLTGDEESYKVVSPATIANIYTGITNTLNLFLTGIAAISLIVGGIGIMNIMLVSVAERTKEIGIRKALGATPKVIRGQFLVEAVVLTLFGGLIGIALGVGLSYIITLFLKWLFAPKFSAFLLAVLFSSAVGIFFGLYPAVQASRLQPVEALTYE